MPMHRWDPFVEMRRRDRLFNRLWSLPAMQSGSQHWSAPTDVVREGDEVVVRVSLPGVAPEDIEVTVEDGVLSISGETPLESEESNTRYLLRERRGGKFDRRLRLPDYVDAEKAETKYENGVVTISFPKLESKRPKRLEVKAA